MAGGGVVVDKGSIKDYHYPAKFTMFVFMSCLVASFGGLIFGYDIGISGGVTSMDSFLSKFFPRVYEQQKHVTSKNQYCKFENHMLTMFTSSLYLAALIASFFASWITRVLGRKWSMFVGGITFLLGSALNAVAKNVAMLIIGRVLLGVGIGFANQSVPLYLSEMAPPRIRGRLNIAFQQMITIGIFCANLINYGSAKIEGGWGWRLSLGLAAVPALAITVGALVLPDTPNSLLERGRDEKARAQLRRIRGTEDIGAEFEDLVAASEQAKTVQHPWANIVKRKYRPQLTMCCLIPFFQQITGMNVIMFYAPVLFKTMGFGDDASLMSAVITGLVNLLATFVSIIFVDRLGRRVLFLQGGTQMAICQVLVGFFIKNKFGSSGVANGEISKGYATLLVVFICIFVAGYAWSWAPLGWLVPSEICPLEVRSAGTSINVSVNMLFTFFIAQGFLVLFCHLKYGLFFVFGGWVVVMTIYVYFFLPETKGVPIEEMALVWKNHWYWRRFVTDSEDKLGSGSKDGRAANQ